MIEFFAVRIVIRFAPVLVAAPPEGEKHKMLMLHANTVFKLVHRQTAQDRLAKINKSEQAVIL